MLPQYIIQRGGAVLTNLFDFSTTEKKVGTWINGKPVYRKVVQGTTPNSDDATNFSWVDNLDTVIGIEGWIMYGGAYQFFIGRSQPMSIDDSAVSQITRIAVTPSKQFQFMSGTNGLLKNQPFTVVLTYTKTTD